MAVDKLVDSAVLDANLTAVANAIRAKGGTSAQLAFPAGFVSAVQNIPTGTTPTLITKTITENGTYDAEDDNADGYSEVVVNVSGGGITADDIAMKTNPTGDVVLRTATQIKDYAFLGFTGITSLSSDSVTTVGTDAIRAPNLTSVSLPNLETVGARTFFDCSRLTSINIPKLTKTGDAMFRGCSSFEGPLVFKNLVTWTGGQMLYNTKVMAVDIAKTLTASFPSYAFQSNNRARFNMLVLRSSTMIGLGNVNAFMTTAFDSNGTGGTLYVPADLVSSYQSASNWSTILSRANNQIKSIESTHTDPDAPIDLTLYYADGTPISA